MEQTNKLPQTYIQAAETECVNGNSVIAITELDKGESV